MKSNFAKLEESLSYKFNHRELLEEALSHPSLKQYYSTKFNYERFEFFGDAILGFLITEMIFHKFNNHTEGEIAKIKAHLVSRDSLVKIATRLHLSEYIIMSPGEENSGGRANANNIENAMEALLSAIYLDSNIETTRKIVRFLWKDYIENIDFNFVNPKAALQEWSQEKFNQIPKYNVIKTEGPAHGPTFTVGLNVGTMSQTAKGKSIKDAEKLAAREVLKQIPEYKSEQKNK